MIFFLIFFHIFLFLPPIIRDGPREVLKRKGSLAEWSKAAVLKTAVLQGTVGSNPTASANTKDL